MRKLFPLLILFFLFSLAYAIPCVDDSGCMPPQVCLAGECSFLFQGSQGQLPEPECTEDSDCDPGAYCADEECRQTPGGHDDLDENTGDLTGDEYVGDGLPGNLPDDILLDPSLEPEELIDCCDVIDQFLPSQMFYDLDYNEKSITITLYAEDSSKEDPRMYVSSAPIVVYITDAKEISEEIEGGFYTDGIGRFTFDISPYVAGVQYPVTFMFVYCPLECACMQCWQSFNIDINKFGYEDETFLFPDPPYEQNPLMVLPTSVSVTYDPALAGDKVTPAFCFPLILIFTFLAGAMYLTGRNPFSGFDFNAPKMRKHFRYGARGRGMYFDWTAVGMAVKRVAGYVQGGGLTGKKAKKDIKDKKGNTITKAGQVIKGKEGEWARSAAVGKDFVRMITLGGVNLGRGNVKIDHRTGRPDPTSAKLGEGGSSGAIPIFGAITAIGNLKSGWQDAKDVVAQKGILFAMLMPVLQKVEGLREIITFWDGLAELTGGKWSFSDLFARLSIQAQMMHKFSAGERMAKENLNQLRSSKGLKIGDNTYRQKQVKKGEKPKLMVQGKDGKWVSVDSRPKTQQTKLLGEFYPDFNANLRVVVAASSRVQGVQQAKLLETIRAAIELKAEEKEKAGQSGAVLKKVASYIGEGKTIKVKGTEFVVRLSQTTDAQGKSKLQLLVSDEHGTFVRPPSELEHGQAITTAFLQSLGGEAGTLPLLSSRPTSTAPTKDNPQGKPIIVNTYLGVVNDYLTARIGGEDLSRKASFVPPKDSNLYQGHMQLAGTLGLGLSALDETRFGAQSKTLSNLGTTINALASASRWIAVTQENLSNKLNQDFRNNPNVNLANSLANLNTALDSVSADLAGSIIYDKKEFMQDFKTKEQYQQFLARAADVSSSVAHTALLQTAKFNLQSAAYNLSPTSAPVNLQQHSNNSTVLKAIAGQQKQLMGDITQYKNNIQQYKQQLAKLNEPGKDNPAARKQIEDSIAVVSNALGIVATRYDAAMRAESNYYQRIESILSSPHAQTRKEEVLLSISPEGFLFDAHPEVYNRASRNLQESKELATGIAPKLREETQKSYVEYISKSIALAYHPNESRQLNERQKELNESYEQKLNSDIRAKTVPRPTQTQMKTLEKKYDEVRDTLKARIEGHQGGIEDYKSRSTELPIKEYTQIRDSLIADQAKLKNLESSMKFFRETKNVFHLPHELRPQTGEYRPKPLDIPPVPDYTSQLKLGAEKKKKSYKLQTPELKTATVKKKKKKPGDGTT